MDIIKLLKISNALTYLNATSGLLSILFAIIGKFNIAAVLLIAAVLFDYYDGKSARKRNIANEFGKELDSLADLISFGVAPCVFIFLLSRDMRFVWLYALYLLAGITRLARFNVTKLEYFEGMPITVNGVVIPVLYFAGSTAFIYYIYLLLAAFLMVSTIKFKKI